MALLETNDSGLYCRAGDFYIDPWRGVDRAVITHGHTDHARWGSRHYLTSERGEAVVRERVGGAKASIETLPYGKTTTINGVRVSLHPAGHILGSAQVRVEYRGEVWVVSGDYKLGRDRTADPFEPVRCHTFVTESTFGLPVFRWKPQSEIFDEINAWWRQNQERGRASVLFAYVLGKAQRLLAGVDPSIGPIFVHGAVERFLPLYAAAGVDLPPAVKATVENAHEARGKALIVAPPSAASTPWLKKFGPVSQAFASGWMTIRGTRRRQALDRGFVLSDHVDWPGLNEAVAATGAERVGITHGYVGVVTRWFRERGLDAFALSTRYEGELEDEPTTPEAATEEVVKAVEDPEGILSGGEDEERPD